MKHLIIPDCQIRPGDDLTFLRRIGNYIVKKKPDVVINLGDMADMASLSSYDVGKKSFEGRRYLNDIKAVKEANEVLWGPLIEYNAQQKRNKEKQYRPRKVMLLGNHDHRIIKAVNNDPKLEGVLSIDDLGYKRDWEVHDFLEVVVIDGVAYSHYHTTGALGRPAASAQAQLNKVHMSCVAGHQQGLQIAMGRRADGKLITSIIAGSCYEHNEDYMGPQGNHHWRGILVLHNVDDGQFDHMPVPLSYLKQKYDY